MPGPLQWCRVALILCLLFGGPAARAQTVTVFAAASLKAALEDATARWTDDSGVPVRLSFAGSSALARQIANGAPADLFLSANTAWMDDLIARDLMDPSTRRDLLRNALVVAGPAGSPPLDLSVETALRDRLGQGRLAMALVDAVPAGIYGKAALVHLGLWDSVQDRVAETDNVRAALALVSLGAAPLGVVYATDAAADPRVDVVARFAEDSHAPILYPVALTRSAGPEALALLRFLSAPDAKDIFRRHGFGVVE